MPPAARPSVSVIVATYNRSNVLALAIESARRQTFEDWEMWVVGDACTDDTGDVVHAIGDERIHFVNLPENCGEQSGPNNEGVRRARGRYVAYLNHDDLWFPDHLERTTRELEAADAAMAFSVVAAIGPEGEATIVPSWSGRYEPVRVMAPASGWLVRRETIDRVGPWRGYRQTLLAPSQDWIRRAHRAGELIVQAPWVTVLAVQSGSRPGCYANRDDAEQRELLRRMGEPGFREELMTDAAVRASAELMRPRPLRRHVRRAAGDELIRVLGGRSTTVLAAARHWRRGALIDDLRRRRGLPAK
jgi:glycosyltransferase involved in cell wall biosynthesis